MLACIPIFSRAQDTCCITHMALCSQAWVRHTATVGRSTCKFLFSFFVELCWHRHVCLARHFWSTTAYQFNMVSSHAFVSPVLFNQLSKLSNMFVLQREAPALTREKEEASGTAKRMRQQAAGLVCTGIPLFLHNQSKLQYCIVTDMSTNVSRIA